MGLSIVGHPLSVLIYNQVFLSNLGQEGNWELSVAVQ